MKLEELLTEYCKLHGIVKFDFHESGICRLAINDFILINLEKSLDSSGFFIYATICNIPQEKEKQISMMALNGNLFGKETGRANIGYSEQIRSLILFEYFDESEITFKNFLERFDKFVQYVSYWIVKMEIIIKEKEFNSEQVIPQTIKNKKIFLA